MSVCARADAGISAFAALDACFHSEALMEKH